MRTFVLGLVVTIFTALLLKFQGAGLVTPDTPLGIINLEFCNSRQELALILISWPDGIAEWNVVLDFLFLLSYGSLFYFGTKFLYIRADKTRFMAFASFMLKLSVLPAFLDIVENILLLFTLNQLQLDFTLAVTPVLAGAKFITAAILVLYLLVSLSLSYALSKKTIQLSE